MPLNAADKIDRNKLPEPDNQLSLSAYQAPTTETESKLVKIWSTLFKLPEKQLSVNANFFELGGDSILSIQMVSRAAQAGLHFNVRNLFEAPVIHELALVVKTGSQVEAPQQEIKGEMPLLPIHYQFFEDDVDVHYDNMSMMVTTPVNFDTTMQQAFVAKIIQRHDALRLAFKQERGVWQATHQQYTEQFTKNACVVKDWDGDLSQLDAYASSVQASLNLEKAEIFKAVFIRFTNDGVNSSSSDKSSNSSGRLLIIVHHLVMDGVSWRILLEDIESLYQQHSTSSRLELPRKTSSYQQWGQFLSQYTSENSLTNELEYWRKNSSLSVPPIAQREPIAEKSTQKFLSQSARDSSTQNEQGSNTEQVEGKLSAKLTEQLITECQNAFGTKINELLLAGVFLGINKFNGNNSIRIDLEGHGREALSEKLDLSQTIGWFTSVYPLTLSLGSDSDNNQPISAIICAVKEQYRAIPNNGIGFGLLKHLSCDPVIVETKKSEMQFNYLGQFDAVTDDDSFFSDCEDPMGEDTSKFRQLDNPLTLISMVTNGCLELNLNYDCDRYQHKDMELLISHIVKSLQNIVKYCLAQEKRHYTLSDFPLATVSQLQLNQWQQDYVIEDIYPATGMQQGLLFHSQLDRGSYITHTLLQFSHLDVQHFKDAWQQVFSRHAIFRTAIVGIASGHAQQLVYSSVELPWKIEDISSQPEAEQRTHIDQLCEDDKAVGYNPEQAPLMRMFLLDIGNDIHQLVWSYHHALLDGWSMPLVYGEVTDCYQALRAGKVAQLPKVTPFKSYAQWLAKQDHKKAISFWQQELEEFTKVTPLPLSGTMDDVIVQDAKGSYDFDIDFSHEETLQIQSLAKQGQTTVNVVLQAAWSLLLSKFSGEDSVTFGITTSGRPPQLQGVEDIIGLFISTIPMNVSICHELSLLNWLQQLHQQLIEIDNYSYVPLQDIQQLSTIKTPLFDSLFVFENYPMDEAIEEQSSQSDLIVHEVESREGTDYGICLIAYLSDKLTVTLEAQKSQYSTISIKQIAKHFKHILLMLTQSPKQNVGELELIAPNHRDYLLNELNLQPQKHATNTTINQLFEKCVLDTPDNPAVVFEQQSLSYSELNEQANRLAHYLIANGVCAATPIGLFIPRTMDTIVALIAILKTGASYVPIDLSYPVARQQLMMEDAKLTVMLTIERLLPSLPTKDDCIFISVDSLQIQESLALQSTSNLPDDEAYQSSSVAYINYTSGSTGKPKGVMVTHLGVVRLVNSTKFMTLNHDTRFLHAANISFDAATLEIWGPLLNNGCCVLYPNSNMDLEQLNDVIRQNQVNSIWLTAGLFSLWSEDVRDLPSLTWILAGGDVLNPDSVRKVQSAMPEAQVINGYGPTENTTFTCCYQIPSQSNNSNSIPIGKPINGTQIYVLSPEQKLLPFGATGELYISGDGLALGYLSQPELSDSVFIENPFSTAENHQRLYRTGDLVHYQNDCNLRFVGRVDNQVKILGNRIEPAEVEFVLNQCKEVKSAIVQINDSQGEQKQLVAFINPHDTSQDSSTLRNNIRRQIASKLPKYLLPDALVIVTEWPINHNGKVDRNALPQVKENDYYRVEHAAARSDLEKQLLAIWSELLAIDSIGIDDKFFDIGGNSLLSMTLQKNICDRLDINLSITDIFTYPSIRELANFIAEPQIDPQQPLNKQRFSANDHCDIAIVGMALRFPDATTPDEFWQNICSKKESLTTFSDDELLASGVDEEELQQDNYVKSGVLLPDLDLFDANYFDFTPREAEIMDPQQRLLFECADEVLVSSGYAKEIKDNNTGVFVGVGDCRYLFDNLLSRDDIMDTYDSLSLMMATGKDFVATRLSHKLKLNGPSLNINTACSTSLVAIHQACMSLKDGSSDMAIAGASSIHQLKAEGFSSVDGDIGSLDGHCRPFDINASGTRAGSGAGVVLLKRLTDAIKDGDEIHAVIKGSAINNDGGNKVGYTAPSVDGQSKVISNALDNASIEAKTIQFVETHGTATNLGDPVEIAALSKAFGHNNENQFCAIGAVKANIGHLDSAAGVAGIIKTVMALKHKLLPPNINFERANSHIDFEKSPFYVNTELTKWTNENDSPLRAGVSSFGIGGTNAHVILESAPSITSMNEKIDVVQAHEQTRYFIPVSAKSETSLQKSKLKLAEYLSHNRDLKLADIAYTLSNTRVHHPFRSGQIFRSMDELITGLNKSAPAVKVNPNSTYKSVFLFPGQGCQYLNMAKGLYTSFTEFSEIFDECADILKPQLDCDIRTLIYTKESFPGNEALINRTDITQPLLFAFEYSLAKCLIAQDVAPDLMIGHSLGEYVAACIADVFSLEQGLRLITARGRLMQSAEPGAMISIPLSAIDCEPLLATAGCSLAAVNSPNVCVASGSFSAIEQLEAALLVKGVESTRLATSHGYHSHLMESILPEFREELANIKFNAPKIDFISNLTGVTITNAEATSAEYWVKHLRNTVKFSDGINHLDHSNYQFIEVGPGNTLSSLLKQHNGISAHQLFSLIKHKKDNQDDESYFFNTLTNLWLTKQTPTENPLAIAQAADQLPRKITLPALQYDRQHYWIEEDDSATDENVNGPLLNKDIDDWFYEPVWQTSQLSTKRQQQYLAENAIEILENSCCVIFADAEGITTKIVEGITKKHKGITIIKVSIGDGFCRNSKFDYQINPEDSGDYQLLIQQIKQSGYIVPLIVHAWNVNRQPKVDETVMRPHLVEKALVEKSLSTSLYSVFNLCQALDNEQLGQNITLKLVATQMLAFDDDDQICPSKATLTAISRIISDEYQTLSCQCIEIDLMLPLNDKSHRLLLDTLLTCDEANVTLRNNRLWHRSFEPIPLESHNVTNTDTSAAETEITNIEQSLLKHAGVYLITGGLGGIGLALAEFLAKHYQAKLILVGRTGLPEREQWPEILSDKQTNNSLSSKIQRLLAMEQQGATVLTCAANISNEQDVNQVVMDAIKTFGAINGVIHSAGVPGGGMISLKTQEVMNKVLEPKIAGTTTLVEQFLNTDKHQALDFVVICSSLASVIPEVAQFDYSAANAFQDAIAYQYQHHKAQVIAINWDTWKDSGMAYNSHLSEHNENAPAAYLHELASAISDEQGQQVFAKIMQNPSAQVLVSRADINETIIANDFDEPEQPPNEVKSSVYYPRPELDTTYVVANTDIEIELVGLLQRLLGVEPIGINDNYFALGGDSLLLVKLVGDVKTKYQINISLKILFDRPTISEMAICIQEMIELTQEPELDDDEVIEEGLI
jgi:amino acid adenylation domain-containing protein/non-ribosomal peptide synthase protein (TIGR01720 family)